MSLKWMWKTLRNGFAILLHTRSGLIAFLIISIGFFVCITLTAYNLDQLNQQQQAAQKSRARVVTQICTRINVNSKVSNQQADYIQALIVNGAKSGRAFEELYKQYGFPPYAERVRSAKEQAAGLKKLAIPVLDCTELVNDVNQSPKKE